MTYCNLETEEIKRFQEKESIEELEPWFLGLIREYGKWCDYRVAWKEKRNQSIRELQFPYPYRKGQKELAAGVYRTIFHRKTLFLQAPTGVGKTLSTLFPAVKAVGEGLGEGIFYLTAKTITRTVAEEAFHILGEKGLAYKAVTLTAKERICPLEETACNPDDCPYAKGHFDRVNDAVYEMVTEQEDFSREALLSHSEKWQVCPFELSLDVALWVDAVICDYNYVFDPKAQLKRFFGENKKGSYLFLIDEAHNLVERGREMYSALLIKEEFLEVKRAVKPYSRKLEKCLERCNRQMLSWKRECETYRLLERTELNLFYLSLMNLGGEMENFLEVFEQGEVREKVLDLYFQVYTFLEACDRLDDHYVIYTEMMEDGRFQVKLFCVDPSTNLQQCLDKGNSAIFFSATMLPVRYYIKLLGEDPTPYTMYAESSFLKSKKLVLVGRDVSSRYTRRGYEEYRKIASYIQVAIGQKKGNYLVFFPSYRMMEDVADCFLEINKGETRVQMQRQGMGEKEKEAFLAAFEEKDKSSMAAFCVMGGIFGEGIDLKHDRVIGAIIVGTGLPQVCNEREILKNYYDKRGEDGFAYAYLYPGMNKVLQSAGRVIRTDEDTGIILLLDERFGNRQYLELFPREWADYNFCTWKDAGEKIQDFWRGQKSGLEEGI
jgi:Rad3-related DNA helicase